jgi:hypothetical protein
MLSLSVFSVQVCLNRLQRESTLVEKLVSLLGLRPSIKVCTGNISVKFCARTMTWRPFGFLSVNGLRQGCSVSSSEDTWWHLSVERLLLSQADSANQRSATQLDHCPAMALWQRPCPWSKQSFDHPIIQSLNHPIIQSSNHPIIQSSNHHPSIPDPRGFSQRWCFLLAVSGARSFRCAAPGKGACDQTGNECVRPLSSCSLLVLERN